MGEKKSFGWWATEALVVVLGIATGMGIALGGYALAKAWGWL